MPKKCAYRFNLPKKEQGCIEHECEFYTHLLGPNPQTGVSEDQWGCAVSWLPILLIENAGQVRKNTASTDKAATEASKTRMMLFSALPLEAQQRLLDADKNKHLTNGNTETTRS